MMTTDYGDDDKTSSLNYSHKARFIGYEVSTKTADIMNISVD